MKRVYMNHAIKGKNEYNDPVVTVDDGKRVMYVNEVEFKSGGKTVARLVTGDIRGTAGHRIRAWIETDLEVSVK